MIRLLTKDKRTKRTVCTLLCAIALAGGASALAAEDSGVGSLDAPQQAVADGIYTIDNAKYDRSLAVKNASAKANTVIVLQNKTTEKKEQFAIHAEADGTYTIIAYAGKGNAVSLDSKIGSTPKLSAGKTKTRYALSPNEDGTYTIARVGTADTVIRAVNSSKVKSAKQKGTDAEHWVLDSEVTEDTETVSKQLQKVMRVRPSGRSLGYGYRFAGASQCMGFGREIYYRLYGAQVRWNTNGTPKTSADKGKFTVTATSRSYSKASMKKLIQKAKPGDVLQMDAPKIHTMIFVSRDATGFTVYDANWTGPNRISVRHVSYDGWRTRNSRAIRVLHAVNYPAE